MVSYYGKNFKEIIPENGGRRKPGSIHVVKYINDEVAVKGKLE